MTTFICIASTYTAFHVALCKDTIVAQANQDKKNINQQLLMLVDKLLKENKVTLDDLSFIGANQGPAPITSLRVALTTVNGLHKATGIALVGIDALKAFLHAYKPTEQQPVTIALFNAYNFEVFYGIAHMDMAIQTGYQNIDMFLQEQVELIPHTQIRFIGNGVSLYHDKIRAVFGSRAHIADPLPAYPTMETVCMQALANWQAGQTAEQLMPLYMKQLTYKPLIKVS